MREDDDGLSGALSEKRTPAAQHRTVRPVACDAPRRAVSQRSVTPRSGWFFCCRERRCPKQYAGAEGILFATEAACLGAFSGTRDTDESVRLAATQTIVPQKNVFVFSIGSVRTGAMAELEAARRVGYRGWLRFAAPDQQAG